MYSNFHDITLSMAVWLANDQYDYNPDLRTISATTLIKSVRQIILSQRVPDEMDVTDLMDLVPSRIGTAIHDHIEVAWQQHYATALQKLNIPQHAIDKIRINPEQPESNIIPVYLEQRLEKQLCGWTVTGKFDFLFNGLLEDHKTTTAYVVQHDSKRDEYIAQGSIYRWLDPVRITQDEVQINQLITNWNRGEAQRGKDKNYPQKRIVSKKYPLTPLPATELTLKTKIQLLESHLQTPEPDLPLCTDAERKLTASQFKYYLSGDTSKRATAVSDNLQDVLQKKIEKGNRGTIIEIKGNAMECSWCKAREICSQYQNQTTTASQVIA